MEIKQTTSILYIWTADNLRLQGVHYESNMKEICVLFIHGMSGNFIENYSAHVLGNTLSTEGIGFVYGHNRGYNHINDIPIREGKQDNSYNTIRVGVTYERFLDCVYDIDAWINEIKSYGYKKIILVGHSLGCNKTIHYFANKHPKDVAGIILVSPPDMVGLFEKPEYQPNHKQLFTEAKRNIEEGKPAKLVSGMIWNWYYLSSQTYIDLSECGGPADNLPILRNPDKFTELASIEVPILAIMGEFDDIVIRTLNEDLNMIEEKAISCPCFTKSLLSGANHTYDRREEDLANVILKWVKKFESE